MEKKLLRVSKKRTVSGVVSSIGMVDTVKVTVETPVRHRVYKKIVSKRKKYMANRNGFELEVGDKVTVRETKPRSKSVRWQVIKKVETK